MSYRLFGASALMLCWAARMFSIAMDYINGGDWTNAFAYIGVTVLIITFVYGLLKNRGHI